eukprot:3083628-Rhodomonas_salina.2
MDLATQCDPSWGRGTRPPDVSGRGVVKVAPLVLEVGGGPRLVELELVQDCLLYTSDAADDM